MLLAALQQLLRLGVLGDVLQRHHHAVPGVLVALQDADHNLHIHAPAVQRVVHASGC